MGLKSLLMGLMPKPKWNGMPEMFLAMVMKMQAQNNKVYSLREVIQWGEMMQKMIPREARSLQRLQRSGSKRYS